MTLSTVEYPLQDGFIHHWLSAGPQALPVRDCPPRPVPAGELARRFYSEGSGIDKAPVEIGPLEMAQLKVGEYEGSWSLTRCGEDHCVDHSAAFDDCRYLRAWAYTRLESPAEQSVRFTLYAGGPADVWVNQQHVYRRDEFTGSMAHHSFEVSLKAGENEILARFEGLANPACSLRMALRAEGSGLSVHIPTLIPSLSRRQELEHAYEGLYLERDIYAPDELIYLRWPEEMEKSAYNDVYFRIESGLIQGHAEDVGKPGDKLFLGHPASLAEGFCRAQVLPRAWEFYESNIRVSKELVTYNAGRSQFSAQRYGTLAERKQEALRYALWHDSSLYVEIAKIALGQWPLLEPETLKAAVEQVKARQEGSVFTALGLASTLIRFGHKPEFPKWLRAPVKEALLGYRFSADQQGSDQMDYGSESRQILFLACEILAGQMFPKEFFCDGRTGQAHRQAAEARAAAWMQARGRAGFAWWNTSTVLAESIAALSVLVDLARSEPVWGMAAVLLDKLFYQLALNSLNGVYGASQRSAETLAVKAGLLDPTSGITRILWGMGAFHPRLPEIVLVALMRKYELPPILEYIASVPTEELWSLEQQGEPGSHTANLAVFRTPDAMLASAQDYAPGAPGKAEHIWQATLGPKCSIFTNHPACRAEHEFLEPNFWRGSGVLPRVAQWKDTLIAVYNLPEDDLVGFTHAWFPAIEFDETAVRDGWAFARKGRGYAALTASAPIEPVTHGQTAHREIRAAGKQVAWVCQLGREAIDGTFEEFIEKVLASAPAFDGSNVRIDTIRGESLAFGWEGPFLRGGQPQPLSGFKQFDNLYSQVDFPAEQMEIKTEDYVLRLDFK